MHWPGQVTPWEWLIALKEHNFTGVPTDLRNEMEEVSILCCTSVPVERSNNTLADAMRHTKSGAIRRITKFHRIVAEGVWEACDRPSPTPSPADKFQAKDEVMTEATFDATNHVPSIDYDLMISSLSKRRGLHSFQPKGYFDSVPATNNFMTMKSTTEIDDVYTCLLFQPGDVVWQARDDKDGERTSRYWVVDASVKAVTVLHVDARQERGGQRFVNFVRRGGRYWSYIHASKFENWRCIETSAVPPGLCRVMGDDMNPLGIIVSIPEGARTQTVLHRSVLRLGHFLFRRVIRGRGAHRQHQHFDSKIRWGPKYNSSFILLPENL